MKFTWLEILLMSALIVTIATIAVPAGVDQRRGKVMFL